MDEYFSKCQWQSVPVKSSPHKEPREPRIRTTTMAVMFPLLHLFQSWSPSLTYCFLAFPSVYLKMWSRKPSHSTHSAFSLLWALLACCLYVSFARLVAFVHSWGWGFFPSSRSAECLVHCICCVLGAVVSTQEKLSISTHLGNHPVTGQ